MTARPVSWKVIEAGWRVVSAAGDGVGTVREVVGEATIDIFNGLVVSPGYLHTSRYVPSEQVGEIVDGEVRLTLAKAEFDALDEWHGSPPSPPFEPGRTER
ncbi:MAG TPA: hypothetical protein VLB86_09005 [Gaiellaceae bacterium]|nr:hypothetical protein [Gaiellaceae bacterium]